jgi:hypothetical protein
MRAHPLMESLLIGSGKSHKSSLLAVIQGARVVPAKVRIKTESLRRIESGKPSLVASFPAAESALLPSILLTSYQVAADN